MLLLLVCSVVSVSPSLGSEDRPALKPPKVPTFQTKNLFLEKIVSEKKNSQSLSMEDRVPHLIFPLIVRGVGRRLKHS